MDCGKQLAQHRLIGAIALNKDRSDACNSLDAIKHIDFLLIDDFADDVTLHDDIGTVLNNVLEVRNASGLCTVLVSALPAPELVRGCDMRVSGKLGRAGKIA